MVARQPGQRDEGQTHFREVRVLGSAAVAGLGHSLPAHLIL